MYDERHYNYWEPWFRKAFAIDEFSTLNTVWMTYFIAGGSIAYHDQRYAFKKILQTVYTSMPDIIGVLFLMSKCLACVFWRPFNGLCASMDVVYFKYYI